MHNWDEVRQRAQGQWRSILFDVAGLTSQELSGRHGPCPMCGGKDRFRFDDNVDQPGDGGYICGQCGSGDGMALLVGVTGIEFKAAVKAVGEFLNLIPVDAFERNHKRSTAAHSAPKYSKHGAEAAQEWINAAKHMPLCELTMRHGLGVDGLMVAGADIVCGIHDSQGELTNAARIALDESVTYAAGGMTYGAATVIGADTGKSVIMCTDWFDAWHIHYATGCQVLCCWVNENVWHVAREFEHDKPIYMAARHDVNQLAAAEVAGLRVLLPVGMRSQYEQDGKFLGIERKLYDPSALLDQIEDQE